MKFIKNVFGFIGKFILTMMFLGILLIIMALIFA